MYNKIIDIMKDGIGKISPDIVFWVGMGLVWTTLLLIVIRWICRSNQKVGCVFRKFVKIVALLYLVFAFYVVSTEYALDFSNLIIYMGYPIAAVLISYILYFIFMGQCNCGAASCNLAEKNTQKAKKNAEKASKKQEKQTRKEQKAAAFDFDNEITEKERGKKEKGEKKGEETKDYEFTFDTEEPDDEPDGAETEEPPMFIVSKVTDEKIESPIIPVKMTKSDSEKPDSISRLAEQIERKRQSNIEITDGKRENKFTFESDAKAKTDDKPKVVARQITETVSVKPLDTEMKTGFTARKITETKTSEKTYSGSGVSATHTTTTTTAAAPKKSAGDILAALEKLRSSMNKKS